MPLVIIKKKEKKIAPNKTLMHVLKSKNIGATPKK